MPIHAEKLKEPSLRLLAILASICFIAVPILVYMEMTILGLFAFNLGTYFSLSRLIVERTKKKDEHPTA